MKTLLVSTAILCCIGATAAQQTGRLHPKKKGEKSGGPTVVVDLTDPDIPPAPPMAEIIAPPEKASTSKSKKKPKDAQAKKESNKKGKTTPNDKSDKSKKPKTDKSGEADPVLEAILAEPPKDPEPGLAVRVSGFTDGNSKIDPEKISLKAPFPAKPLGAIPSGWKLVRADDQVPVFDTKVEVAPGGPSLQLKVRPHILVPEANGASVFAIGEPGFNPAKGYRQDATIGAILGDSIRSLKEDEKRMDGAIQRLEQLLISLPETAPATPKTTAKPKRKR